MIINNSSQMSQDQEIIGEMKVEKQRLGHHGCIIYESVEERVRETYTQTEKNDRETEREVFEYGVTHLYCFFIF